MCLVSFGKLPSLGVSDADKYVHVTLHFVFVLLWGFYSKIKESKIVIPRILKLVVVSILYGLLIEFLQDTFTATRQADIMDVLANFTGATLALIVFVLMRRQKAANHQIL
ncbi:MAG: VanZ family protein [Flavobacterium sp. JAD_PAG50586_2]|nr:MAG: VanZ family protein [Flavobacterium sp. JAD_PAG50586_2]